MKLFCRISFHHRTTLLARLLLFSLSIYVFGCAHAPRPSRLVAVGDVHGAFDGFSAILKKTNLIDETLQWIGDNAIMVQVGDIMDRGPKVRRVMDLLMALEKQATRQGGQVVTLIGNHESFNLIGYFDRHSTPLPIFTRICNSFADNDSEARRQEAYRQYEVWKMRYPKCAPKTKDEWMVSHPLGFVEYQEALSPTGTYGRWLRSLPAVVRFDNMLFVHGGLSPELSRLKFTTTGSINHRIKKEIYSFDKIKHNLIISETILPFSTLEEIECAIGQIVGEPQTDLQHTEPTDRQKRFEKIQRALPGESAWIQLNNDGPLWFRGYARWSEEKDEPLVAELLDIWDVEHIIVGHTPDRTGRIRNRFNNRIFLIDTGMAYGTYHGVNGRPSALEIRNGDFTAIYMDGRIALTGAAADINQVYPGTHETSSPALDK